ncbi:MAG: EAL domain-containing protein [Gammaproteobacteria bacterium]
MKQDWNREQYQLALPAKITGIVFWGMVLIGILASVYILQVHEQDLANQYKYDLFMFADELEHELEKNLSIEESIKDLPKTIEVLLNRYNFEALEFDLAGHHFRSGRFQSDQDSFQHILHVHDVFSLSTYEEVELIVYFTNTRQLIADYRKNMMMSIGAIVFGFGLILQIILHKILSRPFRNMVVSADRFARGERNVRFLETAKDEFGYLARFINMALDSSMKKQHQLEQSRKALAEEKERAEVTLHSIMDGVITTSANGLIEYMNPVAERLLGRTIDTVRDMKLQTVIKLIHEDTGKRLSNPIQDAMRRNSVVELPSHAALIRYDGEAVPIEASAAPMRSDEGEVIGAVLVFQDVSHARRLTRQLSYQASHDALTGLYNRRMFEDHLELALINVLEENRHHALCYIDLDQFKVVNDTCGHMAGDELLRQLAVLLQGCIREGDHLARLGGDEFGVLLENCNIDKARTLAENICLEVRGFRFIWQDKTFEVGASIGVVGINAENVDMVGIMSAADLACYAAKDMGRNRVHVYQPDDVVLAKHHGQMHWATRINQALDKGQFLLYWQPVVAMDTGYKTRHWEVLIRMRDEDGSVVAPDIFIPAAERYNLMHKVDRWVIKGVFTAMKHINEQESGEIVLAINLSGISLADDDMLNFILTEAMMNNVDFAQICFEITETAAISNLAKATKFIKALRKRGCLFALDDFGSGLSSFAYLKNLPVDYIKIDGSFVKDMQTDSIDRAMVAAITHIGHVMTIQTIAEWVDDEHTLSLLKDIGVDFAQGYYLGRPVPLLEKDQADSSKAIA